MIYSYAVICFLCCVSAISSCVANDIADKNISNYCSRHFEKVVDVKACIKEIKCGKEGK